MDLRQNWPNQILVVWPYFRVRSSQIKARFTVLWERVRTYKGCLLKKHDRKYFILLCLTVSAFELTYCVFSYFDFFCSCFVSLSFGLCLSLASIQYILKYTKIFDIFTIVLSIYWVSFNSSWIHVYMHPHVTIKM